MAQGGSTGGNGGSVEVSGEKTLNLSNTTKINTMAVNGRTGELLLDPAELTINASNVGTYTDLLATTDATMSTSSGDLVIDTPMTWTTANTLTLNSAANIIINSAITANNGGLTVASVGTITDTAPLSVKTFTLTNGNWSQIGSLPSFAAYDFRITSGTLLRATSGDGSSGNPYAISDVYSLQGMGSSGMLNKHYILPMTSTPAAPNTGTATVVATTRVLCR